MRLLVPKQLVTNLNSLSNNDKFITTDIITNIYQDITTFLYQIWLSKCKFISAWEHSINITSVSKTTKHNPQPKSVFYTEGKRELEYFTRTFINLTLFHYLSYIDILFSFIFNFSFISDVSGAKTVVTY